MLPRFCAFKSNSVLLRFCFGYFSGKKQEFCTGLVKMATSSGPTMWHQSVVTIEPKKRGIHLITDQIAKIPELKKYKIGLANLCLQHTSASLSLNESWDPSVRVDMEMMLNRIAPENAPYTHTLEGPDDMPAHVKTGLMGASLTVPISNGKLALGTWQGIWLCEHRNHSSQRNIVVTIQGVQ